MKKNFLMVASLLIAAMLMVVSCTQEVAPKNELVEAKIGLAYGRDVEIAVDSAVTDKKVITYKYSLSPKWNQLDKGTKIFGEVTDEPIDNSYGVSDPVNNVNIGPLTPGLWEITVKGFAEGAQVLEGKTAAYFVKNGNNTATVFVSPVNTDAKVNVKIELMMEDLGDDGRNDISYSVSNLAKGTTTDFVSLSKTENGDASYTYKAMTGENEGIQLTAGFNTITFRTSATAGEGGITKTFLLIPGLPVIIKGSVYPAAFETGTASIKILNMTGATLGIKNGDDNVSEDADDKVYKLTKGTSYSISVDDRALNLNDVTSGLPAGTITGVTTYTWYVNGVKVTTGLSNENKTLSFSRAAAGDYTVTCTIEYDYTYTDAKNGTPNTTKTYKAIGDASLGNIRVLP